MNVVNTPLLLGVVVSLVTSYSARSEILLGAGCPGWIEVKLQEATFLGSCIIQEYGGVVPLSGLPAGDSNGIEARIQVVESLKGPASGAVVRVIVDTRFVRPLPATGEVVHVSVFGTTLWETYSEENWAVVKERVELIKKGLYPPPKPEPPKELMEEYQKRCEKWLWAEYRYRKKEISREEYEAAKREYDEWLDAHPVVRDYVITVEF